MQIPCILIEIGIFKIMAETNNELRKFDDNLATLIVKTYRFMRHFTALKMRLKHLLN